MMAMLSETELFTEGRFSYHVLTPAHKDEAHAVLARAFCSEPTSASLGKPTQHMDWFEFIGLWMDHCCSNGLGVVALDKDNCRVAGAFTTRDLLTNLPEFEEMYKDESKALAPVVDLCFQLDAEAMKKMPELKGELGNAADLWCLGVHPDYRGNKIANYLTKGVLSLIKKSGFKYATIEASSAFTAKAAIWNNFTLLHSIESNDYLWKGQRVFNVQPPHGTWKFWVKNVQLESKKFCINK